MPLDRERARASLAALAGGLGLTVEQAAWAVVRLANSNMERAVRTVTLQRGYDPRRFTLFAFGGAGPMHAAELADGLGIDHILVPPHPGVMAALGLTIPDLQRDLRRTVLLPLRGGELPALERAFGELERRLLDEVRDEELFGEPQLSRAVDLRYAGQSFDLPVPYVSDVPALAESFRRAHEQRYGYAPSHGSIEVVNARVRATLPRLQPPRVLPSWPEAGREEEERPIWFGSSVGVGELASLPSRVLWRPALPVGTEIEGPAAIEQYDSVTLVPPGWRVAVDAAFNLLLARLER
jgi:N-methylhydantoinase A